ncbi:MAG: hypothetical protein IJ841_09195 [Prevotella sp.]|nr:hypothetical protein [Prevotella sp.]
MKRSLAVWLLSALCLAGRAGDPPQVTVDVEHAIFVAEKDKFIRVVRIPITVNGSIDKLVVSQYDNGDTTPFYFTAPVGLPYFEAQVDCEFETRFQLDAYNEFGWFRTDLFTIRPTEGLERNFQTAVSSPEAAVGERSCTVYSLNTSKVVWRGTVISGQPDWSFLPSGIYLVSTTDTAGRRSTRKFVKR